eukprot:jgi/Ulvmu1/942/UM102_0025.1
MHAAVLLPAWRPGNGLRREVRLPAACMQTAVVCVRPSAFACPGTIMERHMHANKRTTVQMGCLQRRRRGVCTQHTHERFPGSWEPQCQLLPTGGGACGACGLNTASG